MVQPHVPRITYSECNSWHPSEKEFWQYAQEVHRRSVLEQLTFQRGSTSMEESPSGNPDRLSSKSSTEMSYLDYPPI